eukprot:COSAG03_NODE_762_length_5962_cov_4.714481_6_plen_57_part_00
MLSVFIAGACKQASQHDKRMVEEWTQPASGVESVMYIELYNVIIELESVINASSCL